MIKLNYIGGFMAKAKEIKEEHQQELDLTKVKEELTDYVILQIMNGLNEELEKTHNKLIREKNRRIFFKNFTILILLCVIGFLVYLLYTNNYFDKYFNHESININEKVNDNPTITKPSKEEIENIEPSLEELKDKYSYLLDDIIITENSTYLKEYYSGNLTNELKNYLALNLIDFEDLTVEEDSLIIENNILTNAYSKIFNDD